MSDNKSAGQPMREQRQVQQYLDLANTIFIALNTKGEVTLINRKGCEVLGYKEYEVIGKSWFENFVP
ncbi:MAG: PAS domain S-box protein, partial [Anaerolineales bacterium]|nr:PAS domain S-box protein [Anaerolineales bacterium]